ncbi:MAG: CrcB family protein [Bdellovibrionota bacterium]|nr:CrcB family protein [Bdellovibrionota bacterium]
MQLIWFSVFAALGVGFRLVLTKISVNGFGFGILVCNFVGSFLIGLTQSGYLDKYFVGSTKFLFMLAFLGALTTFSSYALESSRYILQQKWGVLALCIFSHNLLSISACYIGLRLFTKIS